MPYKYYKTNKFQNTNNYNCNILFYLIIVRMFQNVIRVTLHIDNEVI